MASSSMTFLFLASALCLLSLAAADGKPEDKSVSTGPFYVEGKVYCDTCRAQFVTRISSYMTGAKVRLECRDREGGKLTYSVDGQTNNAGTYVLTVEGNHEEEVCEIALIESSDPECSEINKDDYLRKSARISLTTNNGITSPVRSANPLGFMKSNPLPECVEVLRELDVTPDSLY